MILQRYEHAHLAGIVALCDAEGWPSFGADLERAHATLTAPGVTSVVALDGDLVIGFAYLLSDGHLQSYLSMMATHANYRRKGVGRALIAYAHPLTGAQRVDVITDTAEAFYASYEHHKTLSGFRIYP
ncbi:N-acetyltransferase [Kribbella antibiotica]|uniref:N-acetyltransferase n=1 Tax=Kribbella antibiotica TaxID=190195 RepID=A0A4R4YVE9_9ACTN|nr:GNAT family N-acetyltransferase [Kribbella antibiotica]TDD49378.1 N-acetyltransferase [Kribbella antibiotica]